MALNPWMTALQATLGGVGGYFGGRAEEIADEEKRKRQAMLDTQAKDAAELANVLAGVRKPVPGAQLAKGEQMVSLPSGEQRVIGRAPADVFKEQSEDDDAKKFIDSAVASGRMTQQDAAMAMNAPREIRRKLLERILPAETKTEYKFEKGKSGTYIGIDPSSGKSFDTGVKFWTENTSPGQTRSIMIDRAAARGWFSKATDETDAKNRQAVYQNIIAANPDMDPADAMVATHKAFLQSKGLEPNAGGVFGQFIPPSVKPLSIDVPVPGAKPKTFTGSKPAAPRGQRPEPF